MRNLTMEECDLVSGAGGPKEPWELPPGGNNGPLPGTPTGPLYPPGPTPPFTQLPPSVPIGNGPTINPSLPPNTSPSNPGFGGTIHIPF